MENRLNAKKYLLFLFILPVFLLTACGVGRDTTQSATASALLATSGPPSTARFPTAELPVTGDLPAAPAVPVPTGQTRTPGTRTTATPPETATPLPIGTSTPTSTPLPSTTSTPAPEINVLIAACDTGWDLFNRLGEVTNAYVEVQNVGEVDVHDLRITLEGSDEQKDHPDKSYQVDHLPAGYEIALKLTVDTKNGEDTSIRVTVANREEVPVSATKQSCRSRRPDQDILGKLGRLFEVKRLEK